MPHACSKQGDQQVSWPGCRAPLQTAQMPRTAAGAAQALVGGGGHHVGVGEGRLNHAGSHLQRGKHKQFEDAMVSTTEAQTSLPTIRGSALTARQAITVHNDRRHTLSHPSHLPPSQAPLPSLTRPEMCAMSAMR